MGSGERKIRSAFDVAQDALQLGLITHFEIDRQFVAQNHALGLELDLAGKRFVSTQSGKEACKKFCPCATVERRRCASRPFTCARGRPVRSRFGSDIFLRLQSRRLTGSIVIRGFRAEMLDRKFASYSIRDICF